MENTTKAGIMITSISVVVLLLDIIFGVMGTYQYKKKFGSYWSLAEKSSTIEKKAYNMDKFVNALDKCGYDGQYNAIFTPSPDNSFDENFAALKTLQFRLHEIDSMDVTSFEYQTAIQQITEQEQGEGQAMINELEGIWWKNNNILLWNWIGWTNAILFILLGIIGGFLWANEYL